MRIPASLFAILSVALFLLTSAAAPSDYGATYTPEELAAIDQALHAINCTRQDMQFEKDYGKGYDCFPVVRDMLRDPLAIAPFAEELAATAGKLNQLGPAQIYDL